MKIIRAQRMGLCFGVRDAISLALHERESGPLTILGELAHNPRVNEMLRERGVGIEPKLENVATTRAVVTAHGLSDAAKDRARAAGLTLLDGTCPLVRHAHETLRGLVMEGFHPVVIGKRGHIEVRGLSEDYPEYDVVLSEEEIAEMRPRARFGVVAQTTQPIGRVHSLVQKIRERFPSAEVRFIDTVCQPTKQRQLAAEKLAQECDTVVVIGGRNSNNTRELAATCAKFCARVHQIADASDLNADWFELDDIVGITAGTSTPDDVIAAVETQLRQIADQLREQTVVIAEAAIQV